MTEQKAVIFDFDGTLADSLYIWRKIDIDYFESRGAKFDPEKVHFGGMSFSECARYVKKLLDIPDSAESIMQEWIQMSSDAYMNDVKLKPYARQTIEAFKKDGYKIGIGTSNNQTILMPYLEKEQLLEYFDTVLTCCEVGAGKPAPDVYLNVAAKLDIPPENCVVFEDTLEGVLAGKNAGMFVYAVKEPLHSDFESLIKDSADKYIEGFSYFKHDFEHISRTVKRDTEKNHNK